MSRNQNSHFSMAPHANIKRSRMDVSHSVKLTCNAGKLVPFELKEVLPGDTFEVDTSILARMQTLTVPLMDDLYLDTYYFFVPNRLLWKHWQAFCGESDEPWYDDTAYSVPTIEVDIAKGSTTDMSVGSKTVADYLGMPLPNRGTFSSSYTRKFSHLPFRAYVKVWNDWFRNENVQSFATFNTEDNSVVMNNQGSAFYGGALLPVNKYKDYFTSVLPAPQKGPEVTIGIGEIAPVFTGLDHDRSVLKNGNSSITPWHMAYTNDNASIVNGRNSVLRMTDQTNGSHYVNASSNTDNGSNHGNVVPSNLWADISNATGISINELRMAFATQRFYEAAARGGTRYIEILESMFGVTNGDLRLQRPEYLGGNRLNINISQAIQNSETANTPLGNIGAYSLTTDHQSSFTKSFTEHGWLLGLLCIRYDHSYSQGYDKHWLRKDKFDYYWPMFANIGEQPVQNIQIFADGSSQDTEVFGYQEAWAEYRYANNTVLGEMRPNYAQSLDFWHLGDDYDSLPRYSEEWIVENGNTVDRALAVSGNVSDQFLVDIYINAWATRPMPLFSVPGLDVM